MNKFYRYLQIFLILVFSLTASCDSPHNNPVDPENPDGFYSKLDGYAKSMTPPYAPISGVRVSLISDSKLFTETGTNGYFSFFNVDRTDCRLVFQKDGYLNDTLQVNWNGRREISFEGLLKRLPSLDSFFVYSVVENHFDNSSFFKLVINAWINDYGNNNIDSVFISNSELNFRQLMLFNPDKRNYERTITFTKQPDIEKFIGKSITLSVKDRIGDVSVLGINSLKRVITGQVAFDTPANYEQTGSTPVFRWQKIYPGFNFTYSIQVFTNTIPSQLAAEVHNIPPDILSHSFPDPFAVGEYFWFISYKDEYKDAGQSIPVPFVVK